MFALLAGAGFYAQKSQPVSTLDEEVSGILGDKQSSAGASFYASACPCQQCFVVSLGSRRLCGLSGPWGSMNTVPSVVHSTFALLHSRLRRLVLHTNTQGAGCRLSWRPCKLPLAHLLTYFAPCLCSGSPTATARRGHGHLSGHAQDRAVDFSYNAADMLK